MIPWYVALITLFLGTGVGLVTTALCVVAKDADYHIDNIEIRKEN